ncbi:MAG: amidohydrolase [Flavobacteriaceae bacterium]|jgi:predicted amidohydrolase YtcJ|nr:amidohydrolase [Flavobacteriaceae bacterium]
MKILIYPFIFLQFVFFAAQQNVDFIFHHAKIYTVDKRFSTAEAMAISGGKIVEIGSDEKILKKYTSQNIQNLEGKFVYPGFIDAHCHFTGFALDRWKLELWGTKSWAEILEKLENYSKTAPFEWLYGRSWDQNDWEIKEFPNKTELDRRFPNRPVYLKRIDGHAAIANQKALDLAGISENTKISGGEIEIKNGKLTGILLDNAMDLVEKILPKISENQAIDFINETQKECLSYGLTSLHECGISEEMFSILEDSQNRNLLKIKIFALLNDEPESYESWISKGRFTHGKITFGGYKVLSDGALGSRGACLLQDYSDKKDWKGFLLRDENFLKNLSNRLIKSNLQMCTHAIGDSANRKILDLYAEVLKGKNDRRWRIEHAQVLNKNDFDKFGKFSIIPSVQPTHATSDMYWAESRLGKERLKYAYAYRDLLKQNGWFPLGTDFPVEEINPIKTFYAAVFRKDAAHFPEHGFQTENALTREQALRGMTIWAAKASFDENEKGSLEKGKSADFIVLDQDLMQTSEDKILEIKVLQTWIDGEKVY